MAAPAFVMGRGPVMSAGAIRTTLLKLPGLERFDHLVHRGSPRPKNLDVGRHQFPHRTDRIEYNP